MKCTTLLIAFSVLVSFTASGQDIVFPGEDWTVVDPELVGFDSAMLDEAAAKLPDSTKTIVVRDGRVIWQGEDVDDIHANAFSITKSFASTTLGMLIQDGQLALDTNVADYAPTLAERFSDVTFEHLVKQSGNISGSIGRPSAPLFEESGSQFVYNWGSNNNALSYGLSVAAGKSLEDFVHERIGTPLQMKSQPMFQQRGSIVDGERISFNVAESGISISASDLARFGLLYMNRGDWNGEQLLSQQYVDAATTVQVENVPVNGNSLFDFVGSFGYGWWRVRPDRFYADGYDTNRLSVNPDRGLIVASLGFGINNDFGPINRFLDDVEAAEIPLVWDGLGNGEWHDVGPTDASRWTFRNESSTRLPGTNTRISRNEVRVTQPVPTAGTIDVHQDGRLVVAADLSAIDISVENGSLAVEATGNLTTNEISVRDASLDMQGGVLEASSLDIRNSLANLSNANVGRLAVLQSSMTLQGPLHIEQTSMSDTQVTVINTAAPVVIEPTRLRSVLLTLEVDATAWHSPIGIGNSASVRGPNIGGVVLDLNLSASLDANTLAGTTLNLFDWSIEPRDEFEDIVLSNRLTADLSGLYTDGTIKITSVLGSPETDGDFDADEQFTAADLNAIYDRVRAGSTDSYYDVDGNGVVAVDDLHMWLTDFKETLPGDSNLDGEVGFDDFLSLSKSFGQEGGWQNGDWNADGRIEFDDFLLLSKNYSSTAVETKPVPEPCCPVLWLLPCAAVLMKRRKGRSTDTNTQSRNSRH